jgi:pimeloyl-ACP methyl ester carboxylesterase
MSSPFPVTVHPFSSPTPFSCAYEHGPSSSNALIYIGGLTSGPHTTPHLSPLITALQAPSLAYSFWEFRMRSSYSGFGYSSLANDAADIAALVTYLRGLGKKKIVLFGASTGSILSLYSL